MSPVVVFAAAAVSFALLLTIHVLVCVRLLRETPRWHAVLAFVVPVVAPYFAVRAHARTWAALWVAAAMIYGAALFFATR